MPPLTGRRAVNNTSRFDGGMKYSPITNQWISRCTCARSKRDYSNFSYVIEELMCDYPASFGQSIRRRTAQSSKFRSTIVCMKCGGRGRVPWDPRSKKLTAVRWAEYAALWIKKEPT